MSANYYKVVEGQLYDYKTYEQSIRNLQEELEEITYKFSSSVLSISSGTATVGSNVEHFVITSTEGEKARGIISRLEQKRKDYKKITEALEVLTDEERKFIYHKYDQEKLDKEVQHVLSMPYRTYYRYKKRVIRKIAKCLGLI